MTMAYNPTLDHLAIVTTARAARDAMPPGPARAWTTVNDVCLQLQALGEDAGLTAKSTGTNFNGYSIDVVSYHDGTWVDALADADGPAIPTWQVHVGGDPGLWRPPIEEVPGPEPDPEPDCNYCALLRVGVAALVGLREDLAVIKSELASANEQRQVTIAELARIFSRLEVTPTMQQLTQTPVLVKFRW